MLNRRHITALAAAALACTTLGAQAQAQEWPTKPVRLITPFPAGAGPEVVLRMVADKLQKKWGKPVIVENKPGGNGFIAISEFKRGATDGHDLIQLDNVHLAAYPHLFKKLPYDPVKDFEPLLPLFKAYFFLAVPSNSPYKNVGELIADAKARPTVLNYGSWSVGNPVHLGSALLESMTNTQMQHIVYKEVSLLYAGVANGELNWSLGTAASAGPMVRAGKVKFLAVAGPKRLATFPDIPTVAESGGPAGYEVTGWTTLAAPKGVSKAVADKIQKDVEEAINDPELKARYATVGYEQFPITRDQFNAFINAQSTLYKGVIERAKASLD